MVPHAMLAYTAQIVGSCAFFPEGNNDLVNENSGEYAGQFIQPFSCSIYKHALVKHFDTRVSLCL